MISVYIINTYQQNIAQKREIFINMYPLCVNNMIILKEKVYIQPKVYIYTTVNKNVTKR